MLNNRDEQALKETEQQYGARCRAVARDILHSDADAEECVNDALLQIWNSIPPASPDDYYAYLIRTVRNISLNRLRDRTRDKRGAGQLTLPLDELAEVIMADDSVEAEIDRRELLAAITRFMQELPQKHRVLFLRRYWRMSGFAELARDCGMSENNVQVTLSRLRKKLQNYLKKEGLL